MNTTKSATNIKMAAITMTAPALAQDPCSWSRDVRLVNGKILTMDSKNTIVPEVTIQQGRIAYVTDTVHFMEIDLANLPADSQALQALVRTLADFFRRVRIIRSCEYCKRRCAQGHARHDTSSCDRS